MVVDDHAFLAKVLGAASQGAVGAVVGATLSAVTEPVVNKVLVERKSLDQAMKEHNWAAIQRFFGTTIGTNFIKFPFFEVVNIIMNTMGSSLPASIRGTATGIVFTSATLPITNYRFRKSMNIPIDGLGCLYQAYLVTVLRDVVYGITRNKMQGVLLGSNPNMMATPAGRFKAMFSMALVACVVSAPGNELRGFVLQKKGHEKPFLEFFDPVKTVRSTTIGGLIMSMSLATGAFCTPFVEALFAKVKEYFKQDPLGTVLLFVALIDKYVQYLRHNQLKKSVEALAIADA
jgi:hypothetical protein